MGLDITWLRDLPTPPLPPPPPQKKTGEEGAGYRLDYIENWPDMDISLFTLYIFDWI